MRIPIWILGIALIITLLDLAAGLGGYLVAESMFETVDLNVTEAWFITKSWAARNIGMGVLMAYAVWQRTKSSLAMAFILHLVVNLLDAGMGFARPEVGPEVGPMGLLFGVISLVCLWWLSRSEAASER